MRFRSPNRRVPGARSRLPLVSPLARVVSTRFGLALCKYTQIPARDEQASSRVCGGSCDRPGAAGTPGWG